VEPKTGKNLKTKKNSENILHNENDENQKHPLGSTENQRRNTTIPPEIHFAAIN